MRCWSCARVARRKRTLDSLSSNHRDTGRDTGCGQACTLHASNQSLPSAVNPHFSVQPADGLTHLCPAARCSRQLMVPLFARRWYAACVRSISCWIRCSERIPSVSAPGPCGQTRAGSAWTWPRARSPCLWQPSRSRSGPWHLRRPCCRGLLGFQRRFGSSLRHCRRYARQRRIRSLARPLLSQLIYIKLRFRQGKRQDLGPAPAEPGCQEHDLQERALAAARQPSPAFQPPAWPRGTPPTVCPSGPELRRHEGAGVITRTDQHLAGQGDLESGRLQGRVGFLLGLQRVAQIRLTHFDLGDGLAAQDPRRGQLLDNGQGFSWSSLKRVYKSGPSPRCTRRR